MTLFRQIAIIITFGFIVLIFTVMANNVRQSSQFLQSQLQTTAQDMATTLGVTVANSAPDQNIAVIETFVNATFDSGYYSKIELVSIDDEILFVKSRDISIGDVPDWFVKLVALKSAVGSSQIIMGWSPYGTLNVTLHPGIFYSGLYANLKASAFWAFIVAFVGLIVLWLLLKIILKPLVRIEEQAEAIQQNEFILQKEIPKTKELKHVVLAMNRMIEKVQTVFDDQTAMLQKYQDLKFRDEETGLSNRLHFIAKMENICKDEMASGGILVGLEIVGFDTVCEKENYQGALDLLQSTTAIIQTHLKKHLWALVGRINKNEFSIYLPGTKESTEQTVKDIFDDFKKYHCENEKKDYLWLAAGAITVETGEKLGEVLSSMDLAVSQAKSQGQFGFVENLRVNKNLPVGKSEWRNWLLNSIEDKKFFVVGQPVFNIDMSEYHKEIFVRMRDSSDNVISAGVFMPVALTLGIEFEIDKAVFDIIQNGEVQNGKLHTALNISESFLLKADALAELYKFIDRCSEKGITVYIEITHLAFNRNIEIITNLANKLKSVGFSLGLDHLDLNNSIECIKEVRPNYVKMNAKQLTIMSDEGASAGVQALLTLVNGLDIKLIAAGVDSEELHNKILAVGVDGLQGMYYSDFEAL